MLHAISEGVVLNNSAYEHCFAYSYKDALSSDLTGLMVSNERITDEDELTLERGSETATRFFKKCYTDEPMIDWSNENSLLHHFPLRKDRGRRPIPSQYLFQYETDKGRKKSAYAWRGYSEKAQLELEKKIMKDSLKSKAVQGMEHDCILSKCSGFDVHSSELKKRKKRIVGSQPCTKKQIKDKVTTRVRAALLNRLYLYIAMTTPKPIDDKNKSTADWPRLKVGLIMVDECKPNLPGGAKYKKGEERWRKKLITLMTGSEGDKNEILDALEDGILSDNKQLLSLYDPVFAFNVNDAIKTDYFRFETIRSRPPGRVLQLEEIMPTITHHWCLTPLQCIGHINEFN